TNLFPEALVQRVEVVTGGASAAYGADALSGVVNFILDTRFEGFDTKIQGGETRYGDGDSWEASFTGGLPLGERMHLTFSADGFHQHEIQGKVAGLDDRDWFGRWGFVTNPEWNPSDPPGTRPQRLVLPDVHSTEVMQPSERMRRTCTADGIHQHELQGKVAGLDARDWFGRWGYVTNPEWNPSDPPGTRPQRLVLPDVHSTQFTPGGKINQPGFSF